jgi:ceramide glucosyltransferase
LVCSISADYQPRRLNMHGLPIQLAWVLTDVLATYGVMHHARAFLPVTPSSDGPKAAVLIAIKGAGAITARFLDALRTQQYANYRLVFALESASDAALPLLLGLRQQLAARVDVDIIVAGTASSRAQKVHNLLAALAALRSDDRVVVFADADILPGDTWLSQLVRPVASGETAASSGYRWQLPHAQNAPSLIIAAADMSIATAARSRIWNLCWGGSLAVDRAALDQLQLPQIWERAASDDLTLTGALRSRGLRIYVPPRVLVASPILHSWSSLFGFMHRQYLLVRIYAPRHWLLAAWTLCVPAVGAAVAGWSLATGHWMALAFVALSVALLQLRLSIRRSIAEMVLSREDMVAAKATIRFARWAWPLIHLVHLTGFLSSIASRSFTWAGISYRLSGKQVRVTGQP